MDEEIITQIGTLEWVMGDHYITVADLEKMRPTIEEDKEHSIGYAAQYCMNVLKIGASKEDVKKANIQAMMVVITHVITLMKKDGIEGLVLLVFATHQLRWDIKIVCKAYVPQLKQA